MNSSKVSIIVALDDKRGIGKDNKLMWHISEDLQRFKRITTGHPIIMGRKTYDAIGRVLPNRTNIIVTHDMEFQVDGALVTHSLDDAVKEAEKAPGSEEIFIIGGGEIYKQALRMTDKIYLTHVVGDFGASVFFPEYPQFTKKTFEQKSSEGSYSYTFLDLEKNNP